MPPSPVKTETQPPSLPSKSSFPAPSASSNSPLRWPFSDPSIMFCFDPTSSIATRSKNHMVYQAAVSHTTFSYTPDPISASHLLLDLSCSDNAHLRSFLNAISLDWLRESFLAEEALPEENFTVPPLVIDFAVDKKQEGEEDHALREEEKEADEGRNGEMDEDEASERRRFSDVQVPPSVRLSSREKWPSEEHNSLVSMLAVRNGLLPDVYGAHAVKYPHRSKTTARSRYSTYKVKMDQEIEAIRTEGEGTSGTSKRAISQSVPLSEDEQHPLRPGPSSHPLNKGTRLPHPPYRRSRSNKRIRFYSPSPPPFNANTSASSKAIDEPPPFPPLNPHPEPSSFLAIGIKSSTCPPLSSSWCFFCGNDEHQSLTFLALPLAARSLEDSTQFKIVPDRLACDGCTSVYHDALGEMRNDERELESLSRVTERLVEHGLASRRVRVEWK